MIKPIKETVRDAKKIIKRFAPRIAVILGSRDLFAASCALSLLAKKFNAHSSDFHMLMANIMRDEYKEEKLQDLDEEEGCWLTRFAKEFNSIQFQDHF